MILKNANIVLENEVIKNGSLLIEEDKITQISKTEIKKDKHEVIDVKGNFVLPGFIDCHVHGGYGVDFETGNSDRFKIFSENVVKEGITSYCQGSVTNSIQDNEKYFAEFKNFADSKVIGAKCIGIHMEGPFISPEKKGAHDIKLLLKPDVKLVEKLNKISGNNIKIITYASDEQDGSFTKYLLKNNILPSVGHTNIDIKDFIRDYEIGVRHVTHIFNGMSGVDQYRPGLATAALIKKDILAEVIADGVHLREEILDLIYKTKGPENICIITDAINAKGLKDGSYKIGQLDVDKKGIRVTLKSTETLAGSGATYDHNVRTYKNVCNIDWTDLIKMTSINIAKQLGIFKNTGSIEQNKLADLVIVDKDINVLNTIVNGKVLYKK